MISRDHHLRTPALLLVVRFSHRIGFEFKRATNPTLTPSMRSPLGDLDLRELVVVHAGERTFPLARNVRAVALERVTEDLRPLQ